MMYKKTYTLRCGHQETIETSDQLVKFDDLLMPNASCVPCQDKEKDEFARTHPGWVVFTSDQTRIEYNEKGERI